MAFSPTDSTLFAPLFSDPNLASIFSDAQFVAYLLQVEAALAKVQGRLGVIPAEAVEPIVQATQTLTVDFDALRVGIDQAGVPIIALLKQLRGEVGGEAASYVHWGATTQDIMDTALVLQLQVALTLLEPVLSAVIHNLARLADAHRQTVMAGRTRSQQAMPIPFGLKVAGWLAPLLRHRQRLAELKPRLLVVQFGGAVGTLASLGEDGLAVQAALATELALGTLPVPWHTQRDNLAELAGWLSLVSGSLAKIGQDIILMAQTEVGELRESSDISRGGSSTMPQKSNPTISGPIIAAARTNASLLAAMHQALGQEHERSTHGLEIEWLTLPQMVALTATALHKAHFLSANVVVNSAQMQANVAASNGLMLAEAVSFALAEHMPRVEAKALVTEAVAAVLAEGRHLVDVVRKKSQAPIDWEALKDETKYFGSSNAFIDRILREVDGL
ncbi:MAG: 3-carboxy-cis,cis-muconate cycloisomerase [Anaerolineae bacterium]|nr:3-carboxy-cis,cis-muconate cycloisomerase [Anaerolineae bacterium]